MRDGQFRIKFDVISEKLGCSGLVKIVGYIVDEYNK